MLKQLARRCGTDKLKHGYVPFYEKLLVGVRSKKLVFLEMGFGDGFSMKMWRKFLPNAKLYCFDKDIQKLNIRNCSIIQGDQSKISDIQKLQGRIYDVIIDDCSHYAADQQMSLSMLLPCVKEGGLYVIEDLHTKRTQPASDPIKYLRTIKVLKRYMETGKLTSQMFDGDLSNEVESCRLVAKNKMAIIRKS